MRAGPKFNNLALIIFYLILLRIKRALRETSSRLLLRLFGKTGAKALALLQPAPGGPPASQTNTVS